jgi:hypothetical protein
MHFTLGQEITQEITLVFKTLQPMLMPYFSSTEVCMGGLNV